MKMDEHFSILSPWRFASDHGLLEIVWEPLATIEKLEIVNRNWLERLFTWPWKPSKKTKVVTKQEPAMFRYDDPATGKIIFICHPAMKQTLTEGLASL